MPRTRKLAVEVAEAEVKAEEIEKGTDIVEETIEAEPIKEVSFIVYRDAIPFTELIAIKQKKGKNIYEIELMKRFDELMLCYYRSIKHALLNLCCGQVGTIKEVRAKLDYSIVDMRCSRKQIKFNKETVDAILEYIETNYKNI